jgi:isochorismate synthase
MIGMRVATAALREVPRMEELAEAARQRARELGRPVLVSVTTALKRHDPLALFARGVAATQHRFYWERPSAGLSMAGLGSAWSYLASGPDAAAAAAWQDLMAHAVIDADPALPFAGPVAVAGFAFDPTRVPSALWSDFPRGLLMLPRMVLATHGDQTSVTFNGLVGAGNSGVALHLSAARRLRDLVGGPWRSAHPADALGFEETLPAATWRGIVADAVAELRAGAMEKVVLAREVRLRTAHDLDIAAALATLRQDYPDTFVFAISRGGRTFLGASPERLVSLHHGQVEAHGLAGSIGRGATPEADAALGDELLQSAKDQAEHAIVVRTIRESLAGITSNIEHPPAPGLMRMRNVQHLFTPISAQIVPGHTLFDLLERLHPTPAVGGRPRSAALAWIRDHEQLDRGWYAGPIGWMNAAGDGEFAVALRSALVSRREAALFAGCGIMAGSDPMREEHESNLKLRPMRNALGGQ